MGVINQDWYAGNATRAYPLDDAASARDDAGLELPPQILVDCRIRFPRALGRFAYVGGVTVGPGIVTAVLMAIQDAARPPLGTTPGGADPIPLGAVTLPQPVVANRHYPIQPMAAGVGGWLVFGRGVGDTPYSGRFSTPGQSLLLPRVASAYEPLPIPSLGKLGLDPALTGVVQLLGGTDLEVVQDTRTIGGAEVEAIIIRLVDSLNRNVFSLYAGPCGGRPESGTCARPPLQAINTVVPDCNGNLTIDFRNVTVAEFAAGGGLALDLPLGMAETCLDQDNLPDSEGNLPGDYEGDCAPLPPPVEPPVIPPVVPPYVEPPDCVGLPYYDSFDGVIPTAWVVPIGTFVVEADDSPGEPFGLEAPVAPPQSGHIPGVLGVPPLHRARVTPVTPPDYVPPVYAPVAASYAAIDQSKRNVACWDCVYDPTADLTCTTQLKLMPGPQTVGGIIWNYRPSVADYGGRSAYSMVGLDPLSNQVALWDYRGTTITKPMSQLFGWGSEMPVVGDWYALTVRTRPNPTYPEIPWIWLLNIRVTGISNPAFVPLSWDQPWAEAPTGKFGLGTVNSHCRFSFFQLEATPP